MKVKVIGAGLAGCEAAYLLAERGVEVELYDIKPKSFTPAHSDKNFGELVCSNSLKSNDVYGNACGLLKEEMRVLGSLTMQAAEAARVPAGGALAVDRAEFARFLTEKIKDCKNIEIVCDEVKTVPEGWCIIATGPLTTSALSEDILRICGGQLHFYDASAPIVSKESIDFGKCFFGDRYGKGGDDYVNCPMTKEEYENFVTELVSAERAFLHDFEKSEIFEGCMPVEVMAARGKDSLRFAMLKPVGLTDGLESLLKPLALIRLPVHELAIIMSIALRLIPTLMEETDKIISAQKARCAEFESGNIFKRAKAMLPVLIPLFVSSFRRADDLADAMDSRCYRGAKGRTRMKVLKMRVGDWLSLLFMAALLTAMLFLRYNYFDWAFIALLR